MRLRRATTCILQTANWDTREETGRPTTYGLHSQSPAPSSPSFWHIVQHQSHGILKETGREAGLLEVEQEYYPKITTKLPAPLLCKPRGEGSQGDSKGGWGTPKRLSHATAMCNSFQSTQCEFGLLWSCPAVWLFKLRLQKKRKAKP